MPLLDILDRSNGCFRWDASSLLLSTIMVPDDPSLRRCYAATLRLQTARGRHDEDRLLTKGDYVLARKFERRGHIHQVMQTRRIHLSLAGAMLWDLHTAAAEHPDLASKNKIEYAIDRLSIAERKLCLRATLQDAWRQFRPVIHWCAALVYQSRVFKQPFPQFPELQYNGDVVISDFLSLGDIFLNFAEGHVDFPEGRPGYWTTPNIPPVTPRQSHWPDAHLLRPGIELGPELLETLSQYVVERKKLARDGLVAGRGRRAEIARGKE